MQPLINSNNYLHTPPTVEFYRFRSCSVNYALLTHLRLKLRSQPTKACLNVSRYCLILNVSFIVMSFVFKIKCFSQHVIHF